MALLNELKWKALLQDITEGLDKHGRPIEIRQDKRKLYYADLGVTATERFLSLQAKTDVVRRIKCRWDRSITEKDFGVKIDGVDYNIVRIYVLPDKREMELSLAYVN